MKNMIRNFCDLLIGVLCVVSVTAGYYRDFIYMGQYCFISGMLVGVFFIFSFFYKIFAKKELPVWLYFNCMLMLLIIFIATVSIRLNLEGAFWFIHIINPIIVFLYWCFFCNHREIKRPALIATVSVFPLCYLVFAFVLGEITGSIPFPANMLFSMGSTIKSLLAAAALLVVLIIFGGVLHFINRYLHKVKSSEVTK